MKIFLQIIVLISLLSYQASSYYTCYAPRSKKIDLMRTDPDIANNLDSQGLMNFQNHSYKWKSNSKPQDNVSIRFQFKRTGNKDSSIMFLPYYAYDFFQLTLKEKTMIVKVVSDNYNQYTQVLPISSAIDERFVWFAFAFYRDHVEVYYDGQFVGQFQAQNRLEMFNNIDYTINSHSSYHDNPAKGYMYKFQLFPDIFPHSYVRDCIGAGYTIYYDDDKLSKNEFLGREYYSEESKSQETIKYTD